MGAVPRDGDVCTSAKVPELSLTPENMPLNQDHTLPAHILLLEPATEVLSYIDLQQARFDTLTCLRCDSLLICFKKFQILGLATANPALSASLQVCCFTGLPSEPSCQCK